MNQNVNSSTRYCLSASLNADSWLDYLDAGQPIAVDAGSWNPAVDAASQNDWDIRVGQAINRHEIIYAGNSNSLPPKWGAAELIATENDTVKSFVKAYAHHNYPGGSLDSLMSHARISNNLEIFKNDIAATNSEGKEYIFGEANSGERSPSSNFEQY